ncbi:MAG: hypothetical protein ABSG07_22150 [Terriglobales bacterium]|jgi:hypothetical protein
MSLLPVTITLNQRKSDPDIWVARVKETGWVTTGRRGEALRNLAAIIESEKGSCDGQN